MGTTSTTDFYGTLSNKPKKSGSLNIFDRLVHFSFQVGLWCYVTLLKAAIRFRSPKFFPKNEPLEILLTGTFFSNNWIISLLKPLALSERCGRIRFVSSTPVPAIEKVEAIYPSRLLTKMIGRTPARLATFIWLGFHTRTHLIGGLHLLVNGLAAILVAKLTGVKALYSCCGGPTECEGGGYKSENHLFRKLRGPDPVIERFLLKAVSAADLVITRGNLAIRFFQQHGVTTQFHVVPGGMDKEMFSPSNVPAEYDLITIGNLIPRKRVDLFLRIVSKVHAACPSIRAIIVGDGPLRESLEAQARELNVQDVVCFAGHQAQVTDYLQRAKIFILTSEWEGLSQSMIQAMLCGLPVIASNVGEIKELVEHEVNGFLLHDFTDIAFTEPIIRLLGDEVERAAFSKAARLAAERCDVHHLARYWDRILNDLADSYTTASA